mmetsp:Transcript_103638/g.332173  ORF Transcript_103638/g.332173 Transcript_103638/m.332173 type:complete len:243 (-) Transcript_103638:2771-3499(-)
MLGKKRRQHRTLARVHVEKLVEPAIVVHDLHVRKGKVGLHSDLGLGTFAAEVGLVLLAMPSLARLILPADAAEEMLVGLGGKLHLVLLVALTSAEWARWCPGRRPIVGVRIRVNNRARLPARVAGRSALSPPPLRFRKLLRGRRRRRRRLGRRRHAPRCLHGNHRRRRRGLRRQRRRNRGRSGRNRSGRHGHHSAPLDGCEAEARPCNRNLGLLPVFFFRFAPASFFLWEVIFEKLSDRSFP